MFRSFLITALIAFSLLLLCEGDTPLGQTLQDLWNPKWNPLRDERIPRLLILLFSGASLAVTGAVMQALFCNPLASPSILGMTSGGSLAVMGIFILGLPHLYPYSIPLAAIIGSLVTLLIVYNLARINGHIVMPSLLLSGIAITTVLIAIQGALMYTYRDHWQLIQTLTEWQAGTTWDRSWQQAHFQIPLAITGLIGVWRYRSELNLLMLGEEEALNLGVDVKRARWHLFLCSALLSGGTLASMGIIPFFGLMIPHIARLTTGLNHKALIPTCAIVGSLFLIVMDYILRAAQIHAITIGNISSLIGGLFFLGLFIQKQRSSCLPSIA